MKINHPVTDREVTMSEGTILVTHTDSKGRITQANDAFVDISGFSREELIGSNHNIVRHPDMPPEAFADMWQCLNAGRPWRGLVKNRCKNGNFYWVDANVTPVSENGRVQSFVSARYAPSREQIRTAELLYEQVRLKKTEIRTVSLSDRLNFIRRLAVGKKIALLMLLLILPSLLLIKMFVDEKNVNIDFAKQELKGLEYITPLKQLLAEIVRHRSLVSGNTHENPLNNQAIDDIFNVIDTLESRYGQEFASAGKWQKIKQDWAAIRQMPISVTQDNNVLQHGKLIEQIGELLVHVSDRSNLTLDPEADTYYMMMLISVRLPEFIDYTSEFSSVNVNNAAKGGELNEKAKTQIAILDQRIRNRYKKIIHDINAVYEANPDLKPQILEKEAVFSKAVTAMLDLVQQEIAAGKTLSISTERVAAQGEGTLEAVNNLYGQMNSLLKLRLEARIANLQSSIRVQLGAVLLTLILVSILGFLIAKYLVSNLKEVNRLLSKVGEGELRNRIDLDGYDEMGELLRGLQTMQVNLNVNISETREQAIKSTRVERALDNVNSCVMLANNQFEVIYMNKAVQAMFKHAEADIRKQLPEFDAGKVMGASIDVFHKNPEHQRAMLGKLNTTYQAPIQIGGRHLQITANPVQDKGGQRIGTVVEWLDRTNEVKIEQEIAGIVEAVKTGELSSRIDLADKHGFFEKLSAGINELTDTIEQVFADIAGSMQSLAEGDLNNKIAGDYQGMYLACKEDINSTIDKLREIFKEVSEAADFINQSSQEIASGNNNLSQRAEQQAANLQETAASMEELTSTVKNNADNAQQANILASKTQNLAEKGGNIVKSAVSAMEEINESSGKISEIIGIIDEIAFQTNLLALNASVEAARAGELGRGFSVVATEVRNLAQRSATAAKESKVQIQNSVQKVRSGTALVNETGKSLTEIVLEVRKVGGIVAEIAAASIQQSAGIGQVNQAVSQMDEITQQNAALAEQASAASVSMSDLSVKMVELLGFFKLEKQTPGKRLAADAGKPESIKNTVKKQRTPHKYAATNEDGEWLDF